MTVKHHTGYPLLSSQLEGVGGLFSPQQQESTPQKRDEDRAKVLAWFRDSTGTPYDCAKGLQMLYTTVLPRCTELKQLKYLSKIPGVRKGTGLGGTSASLIITLAGTKALDSGLPIPRPPKKAKQEAAA
jgi:hypothetical protein